MASLTANMKADFEDSRNLPAQTPAIMNCHSYHAGKRRAREYIIEIFIIIQALIRTILTTFLHPVIPLTGRIIKKKPNSIS